MFHVEEVSSKGLSSVPETTEGTALEPGTGLELKVEQNTPNLSGVSLSTPSLNGHADTFWQIVKESPGLLPVQIANKFQHATKRTISGAQAKALIAKGPPIYQFDDEEEI